MFIRSASLQILNIWIFSIIVDITGDSAVLYKWAKNECEIKAYDVECWINVCNNNQNIKNQIKRQSNQIDIHKSWNCYMNEDDKWSATSRKLK